MASANLSQYRVRPIPPHRSSANTASSVSAVSGHSSLSASTASSAVTAAGLASHSAAAGLQSAPTAANATSYNDASKYMQMGVPAINTTSAMGAGGTVGPAGQVRPGDRERRQSQISTHSNDSRSRRNSALYGVYPSPAPSTAASPTQAQGSFSLSTSSTMPMGGFAMYGNAPQIHTQDININPTHPTISSPLSTSQSPSGSYIPAAMSSSMAMLQGIEAQLQTASYRTAPPGNPYGNAQSSSSASSNSGVSGPTHRIPAVYQAAHRPASTTVIPVQTTSAQLQHNTPVFLSPQHQQAFQIPQQQAQYLYPQNPNFSQSARGPHPSAQLDYLHTTVPSASVGSSTLPPTNAAVAANAAAAYRNRASHQIVPISAAASAAAANPPPVNIALHTAQYTNSSRPKIYFGNYQLLHTLGEGEFGKVKLGVHSQKWGEEVAIKLIKKGSIENTARHVKVQREIDVLKVVKHPHIVRLHEVIETDKYIGIVLEYASGGELFEYILAHKHLRENVACKLFAQLISGVAYLHAKKVVHRDLKLENLLLDRNRNIIITDFGFANRFNESGNDLMATSCGSPCYAAPELVLHDGSYVGSAVDVWSCGVILYAMLSGYLPYDDDPANPDGDNINLLYRYITSTKLSFPDWISPEPRELLLMMLVSDPSKRCTLRDVMKHPWLRRYSQFFRNSVDELENQAAALYEEKAMLLRRQQQEYFQAQQGRVASPGMARSMSTPGVESASHQRHRSAIVPAATQLTPEMLSPPLEQHRPHLPSAQVATGAPPSASSRQRHAQSALVVPTSGTMPNLAGYTSPNQYSMPTIQASPPKLSEPQFVTSHPMTPSSSAPGGVESTLDSLASEGELRGEPRSRRTDDDDTSSSSARAPRNGHRPASSAVVPKSTPPLSPESKKRKNEEKRYTVQLEYTAPPSDSTRSKTKAREPQQQVLQPGSSVFASAGFVHSPTLPNLTGLSTPTVSPPQAQSSAQRELPAFVEPVDRSIPISEAAAAAESMDVHMQSPDASPARSYRDASDMSTESAVPIIISPSLPGIAHKPERLEGAALPLQAAATTVSVETHRTPPSSPKGSLGQSTPQRMQSVPTAQMDATPKASRPDPSPRESQVPFPSPKTDRRPSGTAVARNDSVKYAERPGLSDRPPTASSQKSSTRQKKGLSISRFLGSSTTSVDKMAASGLPARSRNSTSTDRPVVSGLPPSSSTTTFTDLIGEKKPNRRRKALSLVVDPFGKSLTSTAQAAAKNRRSARVQTDAAVPLRERTGSSATAYGSSRSPALPTASIPVSPSLSVVHANASRQSVVPSSYEAQPAYEGLSRVPSKSKRVSDWFRWKGSQRQSAAVSPAVLAAPLPIKTDFDKRQQQSSVASRQSVATAASIDRQHVAPINKRTTQPATPTVVVTGANQAGSVTTANTSQTKTVAPVTQTRSKEPINVQTGLTSTRMTRARTATSETEDALTFDETKLKVHNGATDKRVVTKTHPNMILKEVNRVLQEMGMDVSPNSDFRVKVTRRSKKQVAALNGLGVQTDRRTIAASPLSPSPSSAFRSFFGRKNSTTTQSLLQQSPSMPSPALTASSVIDSPLPDSSTAWSSPLTASGSTQGPAQILPYYGTEQVDSGGEVRFTVEITRVKGLTGLYTLDLRRLMGKLPDYRETHETFLNRLQLGSAT